MSVFKRMDDFGNSPVTPFLVNLNIALGKQFDALTKARSAVSLVGKILLAIEDMLAKLANAAKSAANAMRLNPLASGVLKIVARIVIAFLNVAEKLIDGAATFVSGVRTAFKGGIERKLIKKIDTIEDKIFEIMNVDGELQKLVGFIQRVARFLKTQEDAGYYPTDKLQSIDNQFNAIFYQKVPPIEHHVTVILDEIEPIKQAMARIKAEIDAVQAALSPFAAIVTAFDATIGLVLRKVSAVATSIKQWIDDKVAWLGWLLDSIEWVIDEAMKLFGVDKLIDWVKRQLGNVPFIKEAQDFAARLQALHQQLEAELKKYFGRILNLGQEIFIDVRNSVQGHTNETFIFIMGLGIKKGVLEWALPKRIKDLTTKLIGAIEVLKAAAEREESEEAENAPELPEHLVMTLDSIADDIQFVERYVVSIEKSELQMQPLTDLYTSAMEKMAKLKRIPNYRGADRLSSAAIKQQLEVKLGLVRQLDAVAQQVTEVVLDIGLDLNDELPRLLESFDEHHFAVLGDQVGLQAIMNR